MKRSNLTHSKVEEIIASQMDEGEKMKLCNFIIINNDKQPIIPQVLKIHKNLLNIVSGK